MVVGHVPGAPVPVDAWTPRLLHAHVRQLARLHHRRYRWHGELHRATDDRADRIDIVGHLAANLDWWRGHHPTILDQAEVRRLTPAVERYVADGADAFRTLDAFALVHGDAVATNVLVADGTPRYVDWEWAQIGDPAQDLAHIGGRIGAAPWYVTLDDDAIATMLDRYVDAVTGRGAHRRRDPTLATRRDVWEVVERFLSSLHFRTVRRSSRDVETDGRYDAAVEHLTTGLSELLGR